MGMWVCVSVCGFVYVFECLGVSVCLIMCVWVCSFRFSDVVFLAECVCMWVCEFSMCMYVCVCVCIFLYFHFRISLFFFLF